MLFLSGPRQVGKTTLVQQRLCKRGVGYYNWDDRAVRRAYARDPHFFVGAKSSWVCFDEIHKRPKWKDILKGAFDVFKDRYHFVVTGSALLKTFKRSGDSLVGRYFHSQIFPLNLADFSETDFSLPPSWDAVTVAAADLSDARELQTLLRFGGFPEPFFKAKETFWKCWSREHVDLIMTEDLRDVSRVTEVDRIEQIPHILASRAGQLMSYSNIARDLETSHVNVKRWLQMLERLQVLFSVGPYSHNISRSYVKEKKYYFVDWSFAQENRFENYVAASLLRTAQLYGDRFGEDITLHFVRTRDGSEVDFLLCRGQRPWLLVEAKAGSPDPSRAVYRFCAELKVPCVLVTLKPDFYRRIKTYGPAIHQISWARWGRVLP